MKRILITAVALVLTLGLSACGKEAKTPHSVPSASSAIQKGGDTAEKAALTQALPGTEDGYYTIEEYGPDHHAVVAYIDYASLRMTPLCAKPECTHSDESCTACALLEGSGSAALAVAGDRLLVLHTFAGEDGPPRLVAAGLDGSAPQTLCELPAQLTLDSRTYTDGQDLYALADSVVEQSPVKQLYRIPLDGSEAQCLYTFPQNTDGQINAAFDRALCLDLLQGSPETGELQQVIRLYDVEADAMEEPLLTLPISGEGGAVVYDHVLVEVPVRDASRARLTFTDLRTGEVTTWDAAPLFEKTGMSAAQINIFNLWDGWYRVTFENNEQFACFNVQPATGEAVPMELFYPESHNVVLVLARQADRLLVRAAWDEQRSGSTLEKLTPVYAVMSSGDYLHSNPDYSYIQGFEA